jgi:hypothetical protein
MQAKHEIKPKLKETIIKQEPKGDTLKHESEKQGICSTPKIIIVYLI